MPQIPVNFGPDSLPAERVDEAFNQIKEATSGRMYEVNINANPDDFLDWDKPLSEQPEILQKMRENVKFQSEAQPVAGGSKPAVDIEQALPEYMFGAERSAGGFHPRVDTPQGQRIYRDLTFPTREEATAAGKDRVLETIAKSNKPEDSAVLRQAGIPGIKYLDAGSRSAGDGSRNYVVFDDSLIEILRKYGVLPAAIGTGAFMQMMQDDPQKAQELHNFATSVRDGA